jgi:DNA-binding response OmpR family regulator
MQARILWIEGRRADGPSFIPNLRKKGYLVETVSTGNEALTCLLEFDPDLVVLHAASMRSNGKRICRSIHERANTLPIVVIANPQTQFEKGTDASVVLVPPFTTRKLINRIAPLLPGDSDSLLHIGPIRLDLERKRVRCQGKEARLTPRMAHLLEIFMRHPGEVLEREKLFREIWNTEYIGDTRTLDVHISWLREAIEEDPHKPRFLKTIRGVGYRLDV